MARTLVDLRSRPHDLRRRLFNRYNKPQAGGFRGSRLLECGGQVICTSDCRMEHRLPP